MFFHDQKVAYKDNKVLFSQKLAHDDTQDA